MSKGREKMVILTGKKSRVYSASNVFTPRPLRLILEKKKHTIFSLFKASNACFDSYVTRGVKGRNITDTLWPDQSWKQRD